MLKLLNDAILKSNVSSQSTDKNEAKCVASFLNVSLSTVNRWKELKEVPQAYEFELLQLCGKDVDYSKYTSKQKDQFFTPKTTVEYCWDKTQEIIGSIEDYHFIEPSAGSGNFLEVLPLERTIALDVEPKHKSVVNQDFLTWEPPKDGNKRITIGNPPFGLRGHLALKFINHSFAFSDYVCFILPQLFESDGKGVPRKRVVGFNLIHSEKLNSCFLEPDGAEIKVNCIFQIWSKYRENPNFKLSPPSEKSFIKVYSLSNGDSSSQQRNVKQIGKCDIYVPSTCFGSDKMKYYESFQDLPSKKGYGIVFLKSREKNITKFKSISWNEKAFVSTNGAYNLRTSSIINEFK
mgnify:CR=1 FL=1|uniref:Methyltransferase n=1 Tax=viral metagenome TaxID=1070528 RepID=A0A6C0FCE0_9ZZZZ|tara:strand:- start:253 stop:1296 length:1044 start_codon:yes stop_codon:yes gene_type:complete